MWGGRRLKQFGKDLPADEPIGESWELFDFPPGVVDKEAWSSAATSDGTTLHDLMADDATRAKLLGDAKPVATPHGPQFPLLIKFLDAGDDLSVQVHPDDAYASAHADAHLKNETWYVLQTEPNKRLLKGLKPGVTKEQFAASIENGTVENLINAVPPELGSCHYLPSGTVHALGGGILVAEVQTPSDTTYRVYDFKRKDPKTGEERELHVDQAMQCIDFAGTGPQAPPPATGDGVITSAPQFKLTRTTGSGTLPAGCVVCMVVQGNATVGGVAASVGTTLLVPAACEARDVEASADAVWLAAMPST